MGLPSDVEERIDLRELIDAVSVDSDLRTSDVPILVKAKRQMRPEARPSAVLTDDVVRILRGSAPERYDELAEAHGWPGGLGSHK